MILSVRLEESGLHFLYIGVKLAVTILIVVHQLNSESSHNIYLE